MMEYKGPLNHDNRLWYRDGAFEPNRPAARLTRRTEKELAELDSQYAAKTAGL